MKTKKAISILADKFKQNGYKIEQNWSNQEYDLKADLFAEAKKNISRDFYFVHSGENLSVEKVKKVHEKSRKYANSFYKMPKFFRLGYPTINTVIVAPSFSQEIIDLAMKSTRTMMGGEYHQIFLINPEKQAIHCQGISKTWVAGTPSSKHTKVTFKKIDPQNRGFFTIYKIAESTFTKEN